MHVLDLFCGAGGAAVGYHRAGFTVYGVDLATQPRYPFLYHRGDALDVLRGGFPMSVDLIHASPPCQRYSGMTKMHGADRVGEHPDLIGELRELLAATGIPYVIENVIGAPLRDPVMLCGDMFNLGSGEFRLRRHRLFETSFPVRQPFHGPHHGRTLGVYGNPGGSSSRDGLVFAQVADWRRGMEIDWMTTAELREAIPPAYTEHVAYSFQPGNRGAQLIAPR